MSTGKQPTTAQVAKWAAISTLVLAVLVPALDFVASHRDQENDEPDAFLFLFLGVMLLAMLAPFVGVMACIINRLEKKPDLSNPSDSTPPPTPTESH